MVYLFGLDHRIQFLSTNLPESEFYKFKEVVIGNLNILDIDIIAEEFNEDCLSKHRISKTVLQEISINKNIEHIFIEPSIKIQNELGIDTLMKMNKKRAAFAMREKHWYSVLMNKFDSNILCFVGSSHIISFSKLLRENNQCFEIINL